MFFSVIALLSLVRLVVIDPGHFHAALVQKRANSEIDSEVRVFAPNGVELDDHLSLIESFNSRAENPTHWQERICTDADYLGKFRAAATDGEFGADAVVVLAGRNDRKGEYALAAVESGCHVLSDKPMGITPEVFSKTRAAALLAKEKGLSFADLMTDRYSFLVKLQMNLTRCQDFYGEQEKGTEDNPAIVKESVHHFYKVVNGKPLRRSIWYYDTAKQGEGIVDVATHLVDGVQWALFPNECLTCEDVKMLDAREWPTRISPEQFEKSTGESTGTAFDCLCNGTFTYALKGVNCKITVVWNYEAPSGTGDTAYSLMRGTKAEVFIRQGKAEGDRPALYVRPSKEDDADFEKRLRSALVMLSEKSPGLSCERTGEANVWRITYPAKYEISHEEQFSLVLCDFLAKVRSGKSDSQGIDNLIVKYHTLVEAWKASHRTPETKKEGIR